jgi:hypothetical protein
MGSDPIPGLDAFGGSPFVAIALRTIPETTAAFQMPSRFVICLAVTRTGLPRIHSAVASVKGSGYGREKCRV